MCHSAAGAWRYRVHRAALSVRIACLPVALPQSGNTALVNAVRKGSAECVAALLAMDGINVNTQNKVRRAGTCRNDLCCACTSVLDTCGSKPNRLTHRVRRTVLVACVYVGLGTRRATRR